MGGKWAENVYVRLFLGTGGSAKTHVFLPVLVVVWLFGHVHV